MGVQLFDVREPGELESDGRIPGALNIPVGEVDPAFALSEAEFKSKYGVSKPKVTDDNIIFFCKSGKRGLAACKSVEKYGYKKFVDGNVSFNPNIDPKTYNTICGESKGGQIFDVREPEELDIDGRFPGAVNIPLREVDSAFALDEAEFKTKYGVPKPKVTDNNIIFVCKVGKRSLTACKTIEKYGYKKALNLDGGYVAWKEQTGG